MGSFTPATTAGIAVINVTDGNEPLPRVNKVPQIVTALASPTLRLGEFLSTKYLVVFVVHESV